MPRRRDIGRCHSLRQERSCIHVSIQLDRAMDSNQNFPLPVIATATQTASTSTSPMDSIPSISSLPSLTYSSSSSLASEVRRIPTLTAPWIPKDKLGEPSAMEGNRNQISRTMSQLAEKGFRPVLRATKYATRHITLNFLLSYNLNLNCI